MIPRERDAPPARSFRFRGLLVTGTLALLAGAAIVAVLVRMQQGSEPSPRPALLSDTQLRAAPRPDAEIVGSLPARTEVDVHGRSDDGAWLVVAEQGAGNPRGWVPVLAIRNAGDLEALPRVSAPPPAATASFVPTSSLPLRTTPSPTATPTSAGADLRVDQIGSRENRLYLVIANVGATAASREIDLTIDDEPPRHVDLGAEIAPGQATELVLSTTYVQRRASVTITIGPADGSGVSSTASGIVEPDQPNDLELLPPAFNDGHLVVSVRNNSPIPVLGTATISVREPPPSNRLVARYDAPFDLPPDATTDVEFNDVLQADSADFYISMSTDAITDAELGNNDYPR